MTVGDNKAESIYLDACATTPMHSAVIDKVNRINRECFGNPSSIHLEGIKAAEVLEASRSKIALKLNCSFDDVIFTSGATESVHLALLGSTKHLEPGRIIISDVEHPAVNAAAKQLTKRGWTLKYWPVDLKGNLKLELIDKLLEFPTKLVSIIWAQSEVGSIQPIRRIGEECKSRNILFHTDATQILPQTSIDFNSLPIDMISASAHKLQGPKGIGLLLSKLPNNKKLDSIQGGGNQEFGIRSGTESISLIAGFQTAISLLEERALHTLHKTSFMDKELYSETQKLCKNLCEIKGINLVGNEFNSNRLPHHISILVSNKSGDPISSRKLVRELSEKGIYVSSDSACTASKNQGSKIIKALGYEEKWLNSSIRLSLGPWVDYATLGQVPLTLESLISIL